MNVEKLAISGKPSAQEDDMALDFVGMNPGSPDLAAELIACDYVHQPRLDRLSDHSALSARLMVDPGEPLVTSDPVAASTPPTLF